MKKTTALGLFVWLGGLFTMLSSISQSHDFIYFSVYGIAITSYAFAAMTLGKIIQEAGQERTERTEETKP